MSVRVPQALTHHWANLFRLRSLLLRARNANAFRNERLYDPNKSWHISKIRSHYLLLNLKNSWRAASSNHGPLKQNFMKQTLFLWASRPRQFCYLVFNNNWSRSFSVMGDWPPIEKKNETTVHLKNCLKINVRLFHKSVLYLTNWFSPSDNALSSFESTMTSGLPC